MKIKVDCRQVLRGNHVPIYCVDFDSSGSYTLTGGQDSNIFLYNNQSGSKISLFQGHSLSVHSLKVSPLGDSFLSGGQDKAMLFWDVAQRRVVRRFPHQGRVDEVGWLNEERVIGSACYDRMVRIWDVRGPGKPVTILDHAKDSVSSFSFKDDKLISGSVDGCIRVYDIRKGSLLTDNFGHPVTNVRFTDDARSYLVTTLDSNIRLMDLESGLVLNTYKGQHNAKLKIQSTLIESERFVVGGDENGDILIWDLVSGNLQLTLTGHCKSLTGIVFHSKLHQFVSGSIDGDCRLWSVTL